MPTLHARARWAALLGLLVAVVVLGAVPTVAASDSGFAMTVAEGDNPAGWTGTPACAAGTAANDTTVDHVTTDPTAGAFFAVELTQLGPRSNVITRTEVKRNGKQAWYNHVKHGSADGARLLTTVENTFAHDLTGSGAPFPSMPSRGHPMQWTVLTKFFANGRNLVSTCELEIKVWAHGDPAAPASAVALADVPHPQPHAPVQVPGMAENLRLFKYPSGPGFDVACDGTTPSSDHRAGARGAIRMEPFVGGASAFDPLTFDQWVHLDFGDDDAAPDDAEFYWRQRTPNAPSGSYELAQSGNPWGIRLPNGKVAHEYAPVEFRFQAHFHEHPGHHDPTGDICAGNVTLMHP